MNDKQITDHYAIIPTGQGLGALSSLHTTASRVYEIIVRRFLSIFYPPAVYQKISLVTELKTERFFSNFKVLKEAGYLDVREFSFFRKKKEEDSQAVNSKKDSSNVENPKDEDREDNSEEEIGCDEALLEALSG